jgi:DNA-binding NarL/FixJ family response regulator
MLALLVVKPGPLREALRTLMTSIPGVEVAGEVGDTPFVLGMISEHQPDLVLVDADLPHGEAWGMLKQVKEKWPQVRCIALTDHSCQYQETEAIHADAVLQKGVPPTLLVQAVETLLSSRNLDGRRADSEMTTSRGAL